MDVPVLNCKWQDRLTMWGAAVFPLVVLVGVSGMCLLTGEHGFAACGWFGMVLGALYVGYWIHILLEHRKLSYAASWFAVRSDDRDTVVAKLGTTQSKHVRWRKGWRPDDGQAFVCGPFDGWVLVVRSGPYPSENDPTAAISALLTTEVQSFDIYQQSQTSTRIKAVQGELVRAFVFSEGFDGPFVDIGEPGETEKVLQHENFPEGAEMLKLASEWSVSPAALENAGTLRDGVLITLREFPGTEMASAD